MLSVRMRLNRKVASKAMGCGIEIADAAVDAKERPVEPADRRRIDDHQYPVPSCGEPGWREVPREEDGVDEEHGRHGVNRHRPARAETDAKATAAVQTMPGRANSNTASR